jgi:hypothetical protein
MTNLDQQEEDQQEETRRPLLRRFTIFVILIGMTFGCFVALLATTWPTGSFINVLLLAIGSAVISTALISLVLDLFWSEERVRMEQKQLKPFLMRVEKFTDRLQVLEGRLQAFKLTGLNYCHSSRADALETFLKHAKEVVESSKASKKRNSESSTSSTVHIVSSSARGLVGHFDREPTEIQKKWRDLITNNPKSFRILLTHPAYAHFRQPAEGRVQGDIELEILKTAIYLYCVAGMGSSELRFYRGSPSVFAIQANRHILLNPYPYGEMAMDTLCLEFESENENSFVSGFMKKHFNDTWDFISTPTRCVDDKPLVEGVDDLDKILTAFSECADHRSPKRLLFTRRQVDELDAFIQIIRKRSEDESRTLRKPIESDAPFQEYVLKNDLLVEG